MNDLTLGTVTVSRHPTSLTYTLKAIHYSPNSSGFFISVQGPIPGRGGNMTDVVDQIGTLDLRETVVMGDSHVTPGGNRRYTVEITGGKFKTSVINPGEPGSKMHTEAKAILETVASLAGSDYSGIKARALKYATDVYKTAQKWHRSQRRRGY